MILLSFLSVKALSSTQGAHQKLWVDIVLFTSEYDFFSL